MPGFRLDGKVIAVVGVASGIGRGTAEVAAAQGARVALVDVNLAGARETAAKVAAAGGQSAVYEANVADGSQVATAFDAIRKDFGRVDGLIYVAGIWERVPYLELTVPRLQRMLDVNFIGCHNCIQQVLPQMVEQRYGKIVTIASIAGKTGSRHGVAHYAASKGAMIALVRTVAREFGSHGINVNAIAPGAIDTPMGEMTGAAGQQAYSNAAALRRIGQPQEVGSVAVFLCSDAASFVTGQVWNVCGGYLFD